MLNSTISSRRLRRCAVRVFVCLLIPCLALDAVPWGALPSKRPKQWLSEFTKRTGLWQGEWAMFAPRPYVNNYWMTADIETADGLRDQWMSPYWPMESSWSKFVNFRHMNFYNRLHLPMNSVARGDFAEYLRNDYRDASGKPQPARSARVYLNGVNMIMPDAEQLPAPEEITWVTFSELAAESPPPVATQFEPEDLWQP